MQLTERQGAILRRVVEEFVTTSQPVGSKTLVERSELARLAVDRSRRARRARGARPARRIRTRPPGASRPRPGTATTPTSCWAARAAAGRVPARPHDDEHRGRVGAAGDHRDALAGDAAARARLGAAARGDARPARRGASPAAAARDGRRHHFDGRRLEAALRTSTSRSTRASRLGERLPQRGLVGLQLGTRAARSVASTTRASRRASAAFLSRSAPRVHRAVEEEQRLYVGGAAGLLGEMRAEELDAYRSLFERSRSARALLDVLGQPARSAAARSSASATSSRSPVSREVALVGATLRPRPPRARRRQPARAAADGLREGAPRRPLRGARALALRRVRSTRPIARA